LLTIWTLPFNHVVSPSNEVTPGKEIKIKRTPSGFNKVLVFQGFICKTPYGTPLGFVKEKHLTHLDQLEKCLDNLEVIVLEQKKVREFDRALK
jgi:hypothetical protein